jgi:hypothetical protein
MSVERSTVKTSLRPSPGNLWPLLVAMLCSLAGSAAGDDAVPDEIGKLNAAAVEARKARDFPQIEKLRVERLLAAEKSPPGSDWSKAATAMHEADDLFNRLRYGEACKLLRAAWQPFAESKDGPVFGDVAMKLFEVVQGALAIRPDCLDEGNPSRVATEEELRVAIRLAVARDPCATEAHAVLLFLEKPDPKEAFARTEMRPTLVRRNKTLLGIAYGGQGPVMPWHAPVELLTAENQAIQLDDVAFCDTLLDRGTIDQISGWDSRFEPFSLLPNSWLLMRLTNAAGFEVPTLLYFVAGKGGKTEWRSLGLHLLLVQPTTAAAAGPVAAARAEIQSRLERIDPLHESRVGTFTVKLFDVPADKAELAVECLPYMFLERWKTLEDDVDAAGKRILKQPAAAKPGLQLPAREVAFCSGELPKPAASRFVRGEPLWELDLQSLAAIGPVMVVTRDGKNAVEPPFLSLEDGTPYLALRNGGRLRVNSSQSRLEIDYPAAQARLPLTVDAVPPFFPRATPTGRQIEQQFLAAGYSPEQADEELEKAFVDPRHRPGKPAGGRGRGRQQPAAEAANKTDELFAGLRSQFYGFRYLVDERGRSITSRQALQAAPIAVQPQEYPFVMFDAAGKEVADTDTGYTVGDWQSTYANMVDEFMPKALWLAPSPALWDMYGRLINRMPRIAGQSVVVGPPGGAKMTNPWNQLPPPPLPAPPAPAPGPAPAASGTTAPFIPAAVDIARDLRTDFWNLNTKAFSPLPVTDSMVVRDAQGNLRPASRSRYVLGGLQTEPDRGQLMTMYYRQAGADAIEGRLHRSLVLYQDVMQQLDAFELDPAFFQSVPNAESLRKFESLLDEYVRAQEKNMVVRMEMAAVLRKAGLVQSAEFLERGIVDRFQLSMLPVVDLAVEYANSYGFKEPPQIGTVRRRIDSHLELLAKGPRHDAMRHAREAFASKAFGDGAAKQRLAVEAMIDAWSPEKPPEAAEAISREVRKLEGMPRSLTDWLAEKKLFVEKRPQHLVRSSVFPPPAAVCPCAAYDAATGFDESLASLLERVDAAAVAEWAKLDAAKAAVHPDAGRFQFLLGWYWLEQKNPTHARNALLAAARAYAAAGGADSVESLVAARNSIVLLIAAAGITDLPPGVTAAHEQSLNELVVKLLDWKRRWVALSLPADRSDAEYIAVKSFIDMVRIVGRSGGVDRTKPRYFFCDYRFEHGPIPDVVVEAAIKARTIPAGAQPGPTVPWKEFFAREYSFPTSPDDDVLALNRPK